MTNGEQKPAALPDVLSETRSRAARNKVLPSAESIQSAGALVSVVIGVLAITGLAIATMAFIDSDKDATTLVPLSTAAFGVISAIVGAYLGIKIGTERVRNWRRARATRSINSRHCTTRSKRPQTTTSRRNDRS